ncbi:MAG: aspartate--tRNA ligase [Patescibacteria group bacterium]
MYRTHNCGELSKKNEGEKVILSGWVHKHRKMGGLIFVDLRDRYGLTQAVFDPEKCKNYNLAEKIKYEFVIKIEGQVKIREKANLEMKTGEIEILVNEIEILSEAKTLPFEIFDAFKQEEDEELRLKYRYLELRREKLKENILFRAEMVKYIRKYMEDRNFIDIATPILTVSSPEGARDFLIPSRLHPGKFYALPQAPQQYKQLLMVAGFDRYYQIAPCMRDEDPRADRSPGEFYQLDCETSFLEKEEFFNLMEPLFIELTEKLANKKVWRKPFPRIPYKEAIEKYGSDRPDLRFDLEIKDISEWAKKTSFKVFNEAEYVRVLFVPDGENFTRKEIDEEFTVVAKKNGAKGLAWMKIIADKFDGGISKFFTEAELVELKKILNLKNGILFFAADTYNISALSLGSVRSLVGDKLNLKDNNLIAWAWIVDFPMFEKDKETGKIDFGHNPFSMPVGGLESLENKDPLEILGDQYDIIANGLELSSGAVRNKDPKIMYKAFEIAGYKKADVDKKFHHMIEAFEYGAPPHCGFAPGIERLTMLLTSENNIRRVVAFPKNQKAEEPMVGSPAEVSEAQLKELAIKLTGKK